MPNEARLDVRTTALPSYTKASVPDDRTYRATTNEYSQQLVASTAQLGPMRVTLTGRLSDRYRLERPLMVTIEDDDGQFIVAEDEFSIHGVGADQTEALTTFRRIFAGYLDVLSGREATLGAHLRNQLAYLRSMITLA